jgi:hypothetical protein
LLVAEEHPGPALAEREGLVIRALGLPHHEVDEAADDHERQEPGQDEPDPGVVRRLLDGVVADIEGLAACLGGRLDVLEVVGVDAGNARRDHRVDLLVGAGDGQRRVLLDDLVDLPGLDVREECAPANRLRLAGARQPRVEERGHAHHEYEHQQPVAHEPWIQRGASGSERAV